MREALYWSRDDLAEILALLAVRPRLAIIHYESGRFDRHFLAALARYAKAVLKTKRRFIVP